MNLTTYLPLLGQGLITTLLLMASALALGIVLSLLFTLGAISKHAILRAPVNAWVFFIRGTPLLVQIFLIYYGCAQFTWLKESVLWVAFREPFFCATLALAFNTSAYTTVLLKGAIDAVPPGEIIACQALGMSRALMLRRIIFPRALRIVLPAYSNEMVIILKGTTLASTITILDLMGMTNKIISLTYETMPYLTFAGIIYLIFNAFFIGIFKWLERRSNIYLRR